MSKLKKFNTTSEVINILSQGVIEDNVFKLPEIQLDRQLYNDVNKVLVALGAKWNRKAKGHVFDYDISKELKKVIETGEVTDWKKSTDFFFTPDAVVNEMLGLVTRYRLEKFKLLEPSAGQGHILDKVRDNFPNVEVNCIEMNPRHCDRLKEKGYKPINEDFLNVKPFKVDVVLMNPPFSQDVEHIKHAYDFLNETGLLISIASASILDKQTKKYKEFKNWFEKVNGNDCPLPENSFKESGTGVNTKMLVIYK